MAHFLWVEDFPGDNATRSTTETLFGSYLKEQGLSVNDLSEDTRILRNQLKPYGIYVETNFYDGYCFVHKKLNKVDFEKFSNCMIGAYVQLLRLAVLKTQTNDTAFMFGVYLSEELETNQESHRFFEELNQSFGSDRDDGIRAMSNTVKILMKPADISPETVDKIHHEFLSLLFSMRDVLKKVKLTE